MAENETPEFDPRFDPAFQRGFDGAPVQRDPARPQYSPPRFTAPATPSAPNTSTGYVRTNAAPASAPASAQPRREPLAAWEQALSATETEPDLDDREPVEATAAAAEPQYASGRNPFLIVLLALAVLLIAGGIGGLQWLRNRFLASEIATDLDFVTLQASTITASIAIGLGLATAIGVLFVFAIRWRGHRI